MPTAHPQNIIVIFDSQTGDGDSEDAFLVTPGDKYISVYGNFDGATVQASLKTSTGAYVPVEGGSFTEPASKLFAGIPKSAAIRLTVSGAGAGTDINAEITA